MGETGSGKTTLARTVLGLVSPAGGQVVSEGTPISALRGGAQRAERRRGHLQLLASLDDPDACVFATRCVFAADPCAAQPPLVPAGGRRSVACHRHREWMTLACARTADGRTTEGQLR